MYRDNRDLVRNHLLGTPVPLAKLEEIIAAEFNRLQDDRVDLVVEMVIRFLDELRPDGPEGWFGPSWTIARGDLLPLLKYMRDGRISRAKLKEIIADECNRLIDDGICEVAEMVIRILDGLRPEGAGQRARGR